MWNISVHLNTHTDAAAGCFDSVGVFLPLGFWSDRVRLLRSHRCGLREIHPFCSQTAWELRYLDGRVSHTDLQRALYMATITASWCIASFRKGLTELCAVQLESLYTVDYHLLWVYGLYFGETTLCKHHGVNTSKTILRVTLILLPKPPQEVVKNTFGHSDTRAFMIFYRSTSKTCEQKYSKCCHEL